MRTADRLRERRIMLIAWTAAVAAISAIGVGFAGGVERAFAGNLPGLLFAASPIVPLALWLHARRQARHRNAP